SRSDKVDVWDLEEKETDVNIAISMYRLLSKQQNLEADARIAQIVLVSADTDMTPALKAIKEDFPEITVGIILPHREGIERGVP
ncbi:NYN domain-containing protein, partial [Klebsiella pneumoniae]